jgi:hypothetical protein
MKTKKIDYAFHAGGKENGGIVTGLFFAAAVARVDG